MHVGQHSLPFPLRHPLLAKGRECKESQERKKTPYPGQGNLKLDLSLNSPLHWFLWHGCVCFWMCVCLLQQQHIFLLLSFSVRFGNLLYRSLLYRMKSPLSKYSVLFCSNIAVLSKSESESEREVCTLCTTHSTMSSTLYFFSFSFSFSFSLSLSP